jgi:hypothetical protein
MKGRGIDTTLGLLGLKFEPQDVASTALGLATAASVVALPAAPASFLLLSLAVALTVLPYLRKRRDEKRESLGASPAAYLLQLYDYSWR